MPVLSRSLRRSLRRRLHKTLDRMMDFDVVRYPFLFCAFSYTFIRYGPPWAPDYRSYAPSAPRGTPEWLEGLANSWKAINEWFVEYLLTKRLLPKVGGLPFYKERTFDEVDELRAEPERRLLSIKHFKYDNPWKQEWCQAEFIGTWGEKLFLYWERNSKAGGHYYSGSLENHPIASARLWGEKMTKNYYAYERLSLDSRRWTSEEGKQDGKTRILRSIKFLNGSGPTILQMLCVLAAHTVTFPDFKLHNSMCNWYAASTYDHLASLVPNEADKSCYEDPDAQPEYAYFLRNMHAYEGMTMPDRRRYDNRFWALTKITTENGNDQYEYMEDDSEDRSRDEVEVMLKHDLNAWPSNLIAMEEYARFYTEMKNKLEEGLAELHAEAAESQRTKPRRNAEREAWSAKRKAEEAKNEAEKTRIKAEIAQKEVEIAQKKAELAEHGTSDWRMYATSTESENARAEVEAAQKAAELAEEQAESARTLAETTQREAEPAEEKAEMARQKEEADLAQKEAELAKDKEGEPAQDKGDEETQDKDDQLAQDKESGEPSTDSESTMATHASLANAEVPKEL